MPDVVITLNMMNEGVDWPCNDRQIMIGPVGSLGLLIQRKGRGDRAYPGKDRLEIIMAVKKGLDAGSEETRDEANQYLKTLMYGVLTGDMVKPVRIACPKKDTDEKIVGAREDRFHPGDVMKEQQVAAFLADVFKGYMVWAVGHPTEKEDPAARRTAFMEIASEWLAGKRQKAHVALLSEWAWRIAQLHSGKKFKGVDIGHIQVELLNEEPFGDLFRMASEHFDVPALRELRAIFSRTAFVTLDEATDFVQKINLRGWTDYDALIDQSRAYAACKNSRGTKFTKAQLEFALRLPADPSDFYREWTSASDFFGTEVKHRFHTEASVLASARLHISKTGWKLADSGAYAWAYHRPKIWVRATAHMVLTYTTHTEASVLASARLHKTKKSWSDFDHKSYDWAYHRPKIWAKATAHMIPLRAKHTVASVVASARRYNTKQLWKEGDCAAHGWAKRHPLAWARATAHMPQGCSKWTSATAPQVRQ